MKKLLLILIIFSACKSTKQTKNNQLDTKIVKTENTNNQIQVKQIDLNEFEITFHTANPKEKTSFTDEKGNTKTFQNVKKVNLKKKQKVTKDSVVSNQSNKKAVEIDNSKIAETTKSVSDTNNYKWIFIALAIIAVCVLVIKIK